MTTNPYILLSAIRPLRTQIKSTAEQVHDGCQRHVGGILFQIYIQRGHQRMGRLGCNYHAGNVRVSIKRCFGDEVFLVCVLSLLYSILSNILASHSNIHTRTRKSHLAHLHSALNSTQSSAGVQPGYQRMGCLECHYHEDDVRVSIE